MRLEEEIKRRGGRLDLNELDPTLKMSYTADMERCLGAIQSAVHEYPSLKSIDFDIINDYSFNAFACVDNGKYFIGINRGVFATLRLMFDRIMADNSCLRFIGNVDQEPRNLPLISNLTLNYEHVVHELTPFDPPKNRERLLYSKFMSELAIDFVLCHEITHILNGHIDFYKINLGVIHDELSLAIDNCDFKNFESMALEMDADQDATLDLFLSELGKRSEEIPIPDFVKSFYGTEADVFTRFSFVTSLLFRIFGDQRLDSRLFKYQKYPSPRLRGLFSMLATPRIEASEPKSLKSSSFMQNYTIPQWAKNGYSLAENVIEKITGVRSNQRSLDDTWGPIGKKQVVTLYDYYNKTLLEELKSYAHRDLCPKGF